MNHIELSVQNLRGLGSNLGHLSLLLYAYDSIDLYANEGCKIFLEPIKETLQLDNLQIKYEDRLHGRTDHFPNISDYDKFFVPYLNVDNILYNGIYFPTGRKNKKYIAIACYQSTKNYVFRRHEYNNKILEWPYNRYYSIEDYSKIFELAKLSGYDVITLDNNETNFTEKIYMLNELCDCIIGYEGGLAHLAHILKIPSIILPWRSLLDDKKINGQHAGLNNNCHFGYIMHLDKRTYFPESIQEVLTWSPEKLREIINNLHNEDGNNPYLSPELKFSIDDYGKYQYSYKGVLSDVGCIKHLSSIYAIKLLQQKLKNLQIGGVKQINLVEKLI
jgi:hypothetical protein